MDPKACVRPSQNVMCQSQKVGVSCDAPAVTSHVPESLQLRLLSTGTGSGFPSAPARRRGAIQGRGESCTACGKQICLRLSWKYF